jgi:hypothetical protein
VTITADPATILALHGLVTGEVRLLVDADGVDVRGVDRVRDGHGALARTLQQVEQDVPRPGAPTLVDQSVQRLQPLLGLLGVDVLYLAEESLDQRRGLVS